MRKIRTIKELLEIDIDLLNKNSVFKTDLISDSNDNRNFLIFDLKSKFLDLFDQFQISFFDEKPCLRERISKSLAFWLQLFLGWLQIGAFVLNWNLFGLSVYIIYMSLCCILCVCICQSL